MCWSWITNVIHDVLGGVSCPRNSLRDSLFGRRRQPRWLLWSISWSAQEHAQGLGYDTRQGQSRQATRHRLGYHDTASGRTSYTRISDVAQVSSRRQLTAASDQRTGTTPLAAHRMQQRKAVCAVPATAGSHCGWRLPAHASVRLAIMGWS